VSETRLLRVAFIGAGRMARLHRQALRRVGTPHQVVGVFDADPGAAAALGAPVFPTLDAMLREARPDLVHVCTPAGTHFAPARAALAAGAHVYVEKPIVETLAELDQLLALAQRQGRLVCAGHQVSREPAFQEVIRRAPSLAPIAQVDSVFAFRPVGVALERATPHALARQLLDVLPHPLYLLVLALERLTPEPTAVSLTTVSAGPADLHAVFRGDGVIGRLALTLRGRPVASSLTISGAGGALTADFIRGSMTGAANAGTEPLEKLLNPIVEGAQLILRGASGIARRVLQGGEDPGLVRLLSECYAAAAAGDEAASPLAPEHLRRVTAMYETLRGHIEQAVADAPRRARSAPSGPVAVVTGATGFLGREIGRQLAGHGFRVRGVSRSAVAHDAAAHEWKRADLAAVRDPQVFAGADVVVHAAAETAGGFEAHQRNSVDATRNLLHAVAAAGIKRLVYVSSISVLRPPRSPWERQDEATPLPADARALGAYTWGKCEAERLVAEEGAALGIETRIVRPAALVDWNRPELPGLMGRRLFGSWYLGLGRPGLPVAVCDVRRAAAVIAWCATRFASAPAVVNLIDPRVRTRGDLLARFRARGWRAHMVWAPISLIVGAMHAVRTLLALVRRRRPAPLAAWSILRPRRFRTVLAERVLWAATARAPTAPGFAEQLHE
jgi:predicted dehydrogenase/nucleoside-diphosphate-sugar epimerase